MSYATVHIFVVRVVMADHNDIILKIINCVKQYPALYDTAHEDYNRYYKKIQIWNSIAAEVNYSDGEYLLCTYDRQLNVKYNTNLARYLYVFMKLQLMPNYFHLYSLYLPYVMYVHTQYILNLYITCFVYERVLFTRSINSIVKFHE